MAIDGAFLRANASKNQLVMKTTTIKALQQVDSTIEEYLDTLDYSDKKEKESAVITPLTNDVDRLKSKKKKLEDDLPYLIG